jgi:hypothetical protein
VRSATLIKETVKVLNESTEKAKVKDNELFA